MWFLLGVFAFLVRFVVVNRGEVVVDCVADVVKKLSFFGFENWDTFSCFIFGGACQSFGRRWMSRV
jgi:hypothetical protein